MSVFSHIVAVMGVSIIFEYIEGLAVPSDYVCQTKDLYFYSGLRCLVRSEALGNV
jgi:hypothetical protein